MTRTEWAKRVKRWRGSNLSAREFAAKEGLNASTLQWWGSTLRRKPKQAAAFIEVAMPAAPASGRIEIVLRDGLRIAVAGEFDADVLRKVVAALEAR